MLDSVTKRRIDTARDILVGKVPDPKSQVEQITIALIYKFMDDMDAESEELGGERKFFAGEFAKYGWAKLMRSGMGGHEMLGLYGEAITRMPENPGIPPLFRDIFKNAYLPYRDPETLRAFLKIIDDFEYDHSERLGDAFEYLLSVLGSQGDAGQFRTPRHIIDFIVSIVDPKKDETVLDPACGTAGFLISSYKHILAANRDAHGDSTLTPDERTRLAGNFKGYDISPDMVRLSLVNMYLHGFTDPHIYEYDTLTSQDRWNEYADVILANPPFMSPKGGIKPHNRFSVQSKRSEVLFVDYMAEHLTPNGRAGIIVPEGILYQTGTAYRNLRGILVEDYLVAVVSLPAGVFNPYSGVKTSILFLDRNQARKGLLAFFRAEADGFNLGSQRRPISNDDLPKVFEELSDYLHALRGDDSACLERAYSTGFVVEKRRVSGSGGFGLTESRYRERVESNAEFPLVRLADVCDLVGGATPPTKHEEYWQDGTVKWLSARNIDDRGNVTGHRLINSRAIADGCTRLVPRGATIIVTRVSVGKWATADDDYAVNQDLTALVAKDPETLAPEYLSVLANRVASLVERDADGLGVRGVTRRFLGDIEIPLPPIRVQREIASNVEGVRTLVDSARRIVASYSPSVLVKPAWQRIELGEIASLRTGTTPDTTRPDYYGGAVNFVKTSEIANAVIHGTETRVTQTAVDDCGLTVFPAGTVLMAMYGQGKTRGQVGILAVPACTTQNAAAIIPDGRVNPDFLFFYLLGQYRQLREHGIEGHISHLNLTYLRSFPVYLPPLDEQRSIVEEIGAELALVDSSRSLVTCFERKLETAMNAVWGGAACP